MKANGMFPKFRSCVVRQRLRTATPTPVFASRTTYQPNPQFQRHRATMPLPSSFAVQYRGIYEAPLPFCMIIRAASKHCWIASYRRLGWQTSPLPPSVGILIAYGPSLCRETLN